MDKIKKQLSIRFAIAASLVCFASIMGMINLWYVSAIFLGLIPIITLPRAELSKSVPQRQLLIFLGLAIALILLLVSCKRWVPTSVSSPIASVLDYPPVVLAEGLVLLWVLYLNYKKQLGQVNNESRNT